MPSMVSPRKQKVPFKRRPLRLYDEVTFSSVLVTSSSRNEQLSAPAEAFGGAGSGVGGCSIEMSGSEALVPQHFCAPNVESATGRWMDVADVDRRHPSIVLERC